MSKVAKSDLQGVLVIERSLRSDVTQRCVVEEDDYEVWRFWAAGPAVPKHQGEWLRFEDFLDAIGHAVAAITHSTFLPRGS